MKLVLPSIKDIDKEISDTINKNVVKHLEIILKQLAKDQHLNYEKLNTQYLTPIRQVADDLKLHT
jgi:hypothetical protein